MASARIFRILLLAPMVCALVSSSSDSEERVVLMHRHDAVALDGRGNLQVKPNAVRSEEESGMMKKLYPYYHTSPEIKKEAVKLAQKCHNMLNVTTVHDGDVAIEVATVRKPGAQPPNKVFLLFGEHSRELISPESGLYFLRMLCGDVPMGSNGAASLLQYRSALDALEDSEFQIVLNGNPRSRMKVETGDFCLRTNPDGVDLNRNWDEHYEKQAAVFGGSSNPGPKPFSEPETRIFRRLVTDYNPTTFLTIHSGTKGMYMPWAYDMKHLAHANEPAMMDILRSLDKDHCQCPFGAAGKEVGYPCPGTCLDYVYGKLNTPFSFAFEIYTSHSEDSDLKERWQDKLKSGGVQLLEKGTHLGHPHFRDFFNKHTSDFVHSEPGLRLMRTNVGTAASSGAVLAEQAEQQCFDMFNPTEKDDYDHTVQNWAQAYLKMAGLVAKKLRSGEAKTKLTGPVE
jgi:hypothetical protein